MSARFLSNATQRRTILWTNTDAQKTATSWTADDRSEPITNNRLSVAALTTFERSAVWSGVSAVRGRAPWAAGKLVSTDVVSTHALRMLCRASQTKRRSRTNTHSSQQNLQESSMERRNGLTALSAVTTIRRVASYMQCSPSVHFRTKNKLGTIV